MSYKVHTIKGIKIVEITQKDLVLHTVQDFLDLLAIVSSNKIALYAENLPADFFDLSTGIAGEILQKASNYKINLGIIGDFSCYKSKSLKNFIYESNQTGQIIFVDTIEEVLEKFSS